MSKKYQIDEAKIERFIAQNRGKGEGSTYKPWLTIQDLPSSGRSHRIHSLKTGRTHQLLSDLEKYAFLSYEWNDAVTDIREQYPLLREDTLRIAKDLGIDHPKDPNTKCNIVMTTDLLLTVMKGGVSHLVARSIKPTDKLDKRVIEKLEIERRYWVEQSAGWGLISEKQLPKRYALNLDWAREVVNFDGREATYPNYWEEMCIEVLSNLAKQNGVSVATLSAILQIKSADIILAVRHLVWHKKISIDMNKEFSLDSVAPDIVLSLTNHVRNVA